MQGDSAELAFPRILSYARFQPHMSLRPIMAAFREEGYGCSVLRKLLYGRRSSRIYEMSRFPIFSFCV